MIIQRAIVKHIYLIEIYMGREEEEREKRKYKMKNCVPEARLDL